jgi:3-O-alpha-D-mannopyranosyl-alpha-D-mannopyranose xylosylphosphotransferase
MRSVIDALKGGLRTVHLILYDYAFNPSTDLHLLPQSTTAQLEREFGSGPDTEHGISEGVERHLEDNWRVVQSPSWLKYSTINSSTRPHDDDDDDDEAVTTTKYPDFHYAAHSEIFQIPTSQFTQDDSLDAGEVEWKRKEWKENALPTFNSMAIEGRTGWLPGLADVSVAMNDDFFMLTNLSVRHKPLSSCQLTIGVRLSLAVFRFRRPLRSPRELLVFCLPSISANPPQYNQQVRPIIETWRQTEPGESGGLYHANVILSKRFPKRLRAYFAHAPKVITRNLHHEASIMFQDAITLSGTRRFREAKIGISDVQIQWLLTSLRVSCRLCVPFSCSCSHRKVERWREGMLWTWVVANLGAKTGNWDDSARERIKDMFGLGNDDQDVAQMEVHRGERWTLKKERIGEMFDKAGWGAPQSTDYLFCKLNSVV